MRALDTAGLVSRTTEHHGVGRPRHLYDITADAQDLFPTNYDGLAIGLLAAISEVGGDDLSTDVFGARRRQAEARSGSENVALPTDASLEDRVHVLAGCRTSSATSPRSDGGDDGLRLVEHNCAVLDVARGMPAACDAELDLFRHVLGADVVRERHIAAGDRCCRTA